MENVSQQDKGVSQTPCNILLYNTGIVFCRITINCDLCDVEVSNGQELEKHLQSKIHWDTMEHIQEQNNYDDMTIAFLQV